MVYTVNQNACNGLCNTCGKTFCNCGKIACRDMMKVMLLQKNCCEIAKTVHSLCTQFSTVLCEIAKAVQS